MIHSKLWLMAVALLSLVIGGCLPDDMPAYVNDGKTIVAWAIDENGKSALWTCDVKTETATAHRVPGGSELESVRMIGGQVWTQWCLFGEDPHKTSCKRFDPAKGEFLACPSELEGLAWVKGAIPASRDGKKCLLLSTDAEPNADGEQSYDVLNFPELKKITTVSLGEVLPAGNFWWVTIATATGKEGRPELKEVKLYNQQGEQVLTIPRDEARKVEYAGRASYARVNEEEKVLLLAFGEQGYFNFGVFDTSNGKFLWGGHTEWAKTGSPIVKRKVGWSLEGKEEKGIELVKHTPPDGEGEGKRETMFHLGLSAGQGCDEYTPSPDGSHFLAVVDGKPSRLLFIPIKEGVTEKDVKVIELTERKPPQQ